MTTSSNARCCRRRSSLRENKRKGNTTQNTFNVTFGQNIRDREREREGMRDIGLCGWRRSFFADSIEECAKFFFFFFFFVIFDLRTAIDRCQLPWLKEQSRDEEILSWTDNVYADCSKMELTDFATNELIIELSICVWINVVIYRVRTWCPNSSWRLRWFWWFGSPSKKKSVCCLV